MPTQVSAAVNTAHLYALVAGESSGDTLGAGLMRAILRSDPKASFIGIGGEKMIKAGLSPLGRMEVLSVMGIFEVASHLMPILKLRSELCCDSLFHLSKFLCKFRIFTPKNSKTF